MNFLLFFYNSFLFYFILKLPLQIFTTTLSSKEILEPIYD